MILIISRCFDPPLCFTVEGTGDQRGEMPWPRPLGPVRASEGQDPVSQPLTPVLCVCLRIHSFNKYLLVPHCELETVIGVGDVL